MNNNYCFSTYHRRTKKLVFFIYILKKWSDIIVIVLIVLISIIIFIPLSIIVLKFVFLIVIFVTNDMSLLDRPLQIVLLLHVFVRRGALTVAENRL